jgi:hypothetical protein
LAIIYFISGNSSNFTADIDGSVFKGNQGIARYASGRLKIVAEHATPEKTQVLIVLNATKVGTYLLNSDNIKTENFAAYYIGNNVFATTSRFSGSITITKLDLDEKEVSGTFTFQAVQVQPPGSKVINFTNGAFKDMPIR